MAYGKKDGPSAAELDQEVTDALEGMSEEEYAELLQDAVQRFESDRIVEGTILTVLGD